MNILIADDDPVSLLYLEDALQEWGYEVLTAADGKSACDILQRPDAPLLAIIDWIMPGLDGIDVCRTIRESVKERYVYMIMLTSRSETEFIVEAMNAGADDFISKPFNAEEMRVRVRAGKRICDLEQELRTRATRDALTGLYNRGTIMDILQKEVARFERDKRPLAIIFADLDHFKRINDTYGHQAGDAVLREVSRRMGATLRPYDSLGRYGGEELLIVLPACDLDGAVEVAERVRMSISLERVRCDAGDIATTVSIGVAVLDANNVLSLAGLLQLADNALYRAKDLGRNRVELAQKPL